jgi:hypothetical protein
MYAARLPVVLPLLFLAACSVPSSSSRMVPASENFRRFAGVPAQRAPAANRAKLIYFAYVDFVKKVSEIRTFAATANGNAEPTTRLAGPKTKLDLPRAVFAAPAGALWACNGPFGANSGFLLKYGGAATGNVAPLALIGGPNALRSCHDLAVNDRGAVAAIRYGSSEIYIWGPGSDGNVRPTRTISGPATKLHFPHGVAFDGAGNTFVTSRGDESRRLEPAVRVYASTAHGNAAPLRSIEGPDTHIIYPYGVAVGPGGRRIFVVNGLTKREVLVFAIGARGDVKPAGVISGPKTGLASPYGVAVDPAGFIYVSNDAEDGDGWITVYKPGAFGNVAPVQTIKGSRVSVNGYITVR